MAPSDSPMLQRLQCLNTSSSDFGDQLYNVLHGQEYMECVLSLGPDDVVWLVDYLDNALNALKPSGDPFRKCLRRLTKACGTKGVLPTSYSLDSERLRIDPEPFATGGYSDVYKGTLDSSVTCIKRMRPPPMHDSEKAKKAFCQEAVIWKRLKHQNIVPLLGVTITPHLQLISRWMPGGDLPGYVKICPDANLIRLLSDVARGLQYLHNCSVIHGDLKGPNILVDDSDRAQISDFGLTLVTNNLHSVVSASGPRGHTLRWTAPEVLQEGTCSREMDIFSFAMVMYEVFTGAIPFRGKPAASVLFDIVIGERPTRPTHPLFTENLWSLMQRCWAHDPKLRPSAPEVLQILDRTATARPLEAPPSHPLLQELYNLDKFLPGFDDRLSNVLNRDECKRWATDLEGGSLAWLVDYLDRALDDLPTFGPAFKNCLRALASICEAGRVLPASCVSSSRLRISPETVISRGRGDVSQGTLGDSVVCVKRVWMKGTPNLFYRDAVTWKRLEHPNLVPILSITTRPLQIISSWVSGANLLDGVKNPGADRLELLSDVAEGLCYLHSRDVIHGDLKGFNVLIDNSGHARITNFGLAVVTSSRTERWAAPEVLEGGEHSKKADIFAFAMVMIEAFTGEVPFNTKNAPEVAAAIISGARPHTPTHPAFTRELRRVMQNCWSPRPESRMKASQVLGALRRANSPMWRTLTSDALDIHKCIPLVTTLFSDPNQIKMIENLDVEDAQTFVDRIDEVLRHLTPQMYGKSLRYLCEICGRHALFPKSLRLRRLENLVENKTSHNGDVEVQWRKRKAMGRVYRIWPGDDAKRMRDGFYRQIVVWNALHHPNILQLLGVARGEDRLVAISERMEAGNIMVFTKADPNVDRLQLLRGAITGLIYMHNREIIHGNLKGANILIDGGGNARLAGFNLVTVAADQLPTGSPPSEDGAIRWMGPELLHPQMFGLDDGSPSTESDCYALGMVIYEVLSGQVPFARYTDARVARVVLDGERPPRPQGGQGRLFADEIWKVLCLCWNQRPSDRLSAGGVLKSLGGEPSPSRSSSEMDGDTVADTDEHTICAPDEDGMFASLYEVHLLYHLRYRRMGGNLTGQGEGGWAPSSILLLAPVVRALRRLASLIVRSWMYGIGKP